MKWGFLIIYFHFLSIATSFGIPRSDKSSILRSSSQLRATSDAKLTLFSPCKINLFLRIIKKRDDGYHDLASLFQAVGFGDTLELKVLEGADTDEFTCNMEGVPTDQTNLVLRALQLMRDKTGHSDTYFSANLIKECPAQAGLGGGSANAATAMFGANELMGNPASLEEMVEWSADLGSDITFFLSRGTAYCTGRGEIMTPIDPPLDAATELVIVKPNVGLSTPTVFKSLEYDKLSDLDPDNLLEEFIDKSETIAMVDDRSFVNDLEPPAFKNLPELKQLKEDLQKVKGFHHIMMSGSGTSIFCIGNPDDTEAFEKEFLSRDLQVFFAQFISRPEGKWYEKPPPS
mmetsp:Transcript_12363/g.18120  ORF Transcript_12363/g.18120 Transcript_12363/m.18120 type:complete len:345 (-) Transcript_12363:132-1166(-)